MWNNPEAADWVEWMSALKLNYANHGSTPADFERGVRVTQTMEPEVMHAAELKGFRYIPQIVRTSTIPAAGSMPPAPAPAPGSVHSR